MANDDTITGGSSGVSSSNATGETSIRVVVFNGKTEQWDSWKEKFLVKAAIKGYEGLILGDDKAPSTHDNKGVKKTNLTEEEKKLAEMNKKGFGDLILSINCSTNAGLIAFAMVKGSKTKEFPSGNLFNAFQRLKSKYEPSTMLQLMHLTKEFHSKALKHGSDPDVYITELEALQVRMMELDHEVTDKTLILHILNNIGKDYEIEIKLLEMRMQQLKNEGKRYRSRMLEPN
jgi:gag-polypeptide of LTR copia-type